MMIDTHAHLSIADYSNIDEIIKRMGNNLIFVSGSNTKNNKEVISLIEKYDNVYGTLGIHPEEVNNINDDDLKYIEENINHPKVIGIGEIGLDFYWTNDNKEKQKDIFIKQLAIAKKYNKTVVVHSRDSANETYNILRKYFLGGKVVIHCYSYSLEMANKFIEIGAVLGIGGILTFKNSTKLKEIVDKIDIKYLLLETDSPYLAPEPFRGTLNEPYNVIYVAEKVAEIKGIPLEKVLRETTENACRQFDLHLDLC